MIGRFLLTSVTTLALLLAAQEAVADFKQDYGRGKRAFEKGDYAAAIEDLEKAIADNPESQEKVRIYGMRFEPYLPHFYLGAAKFATGDCNGAVAAWNEAISQGLVQSQPQYADLQRDMPTCAVETIDVSAIAQAFGLTH